MLERREDAPYVSPDELGRGERRVAGVMWRFLVTSGAYSPSG